MESDATDWDLVNSGNGEAFGRVFDRHRDRIFRHSVRLVPDRADVDDIVAITFFEAWRRRDAVRLVDGSLLPWLLVTATNTANNLRRGQRRHSALLAKLPAVDSTPDHADAYGDDRAMVAMRGLSLADRQVLMLCVVDGYSEADAAKALGIPNGTVKSRLSRARSRLAATLNDPRTTPREVAADGT